MEGARRSGTICQAAGRVSWGRLSSLSHHDGKSGELLPHSRNLCPFGTLYQREGARPPRLAHGGAAAGVNRPLSA
jgi:hypothetical protein